MTRAQYKCTSVAHLVFVIVCVLAPWKNVSKEEFEDLALENKYGFLLGWYVALEGKIHIVWRYVSEIETQIYL